MRASIAASRHLWPISTACCSHQRRLRPVAPSRGVGLAAVQRRSRVMAAADARGDRAAQGRRPVLLLDVMDTLVYDPFFKDMPQFFGMSFEELLKCKHPSAWVDFECGRIDEEHLCRIFFADGRPVDRQGLVDMLRSKYRYLEGVEQLLARLSRAGFEMHTLSNYPTWYRIIEEQLALSRYVQWSYVSCHGPMQGVRKPAKEAYERVLQHLGLPPGDVLFVDDRKVNVQAAEALGVPSVLFTSSAQLEAELKARGLEF